MAVYRYRCPRCGIFELTRRMGTAATSDTCVQCGAEARRSYSAPHVNRTPRPLADALTRAERSSEQPDVVNEVPRPQRPTAARKGDPKPRGLPTW